MNSTADTDVDQVTWPKPFRDIQDANERYRDAKQKELRARVYSHPEDRDRAVLDADEALGDRQEARNQIAQFWIEAARIAFAEHPAAVHALLIELMGLDPTDLGEAFAAIWARLEDGRMR